MKTTKLTCPHCGAIIDQNISNRTELFCSFCGGKIILDDGTSRTEYKEVKEKTVNINRNSVSSFVDEAEIQKAKNERFSMKAGLVLAAIFVVFSLIIIFFFPESGKTKKVTLPSNSVEVSFRRAVLGKATEETNLIVMEQNLSVDSELVKEGLFDWGVFQKNKKITYRGKAIYTVNLKQMRENDIVVDQDSKIVKIYVPKPKMYDLIVDPNEFNLEETAKGFLSFGDMKFTLEEAFYIEGQAVQSLKAEAEKDSIVEKAIKAADRKVNDLFQKTVLSVDSGYRMVIEMY